MAGPIRPRSIRTTRSRRPATAAPRSPIRHERAAAADDRPGSCCYVAGAARRAGPRTQSTAPISLIDQRPDHAVAGAFEAVGPDPIAPVDPHLFREAMSRLGAAVHVVTTAGPAGKTGFNPTAGGPVADPAP